MKSTKIDWCDCTLNAVVGCKNGCSYCYARKMNDRFNFIPNWEEPQFFPERLKELDCKNGKSIFMDSMSDISYWTKEQAIQILSFVRHNSQHNYIFLSKGINKCLEFGGDREIFLERNSNRFYCQNIFIGKTIDLNCKYNPFEQYDFLSIEPILEPIDNAKLFKYNRYLKQVIIGAETGHREGKVIPKKEWIDYIVKCCDEANLKVFMKSSLRSIMGKDFRQDKLIWEIK